MIRRVLTWATVAAALLLVTQVVLPGPRGVPGRGTPWATVFVGVTDGLIVALTASGIVLVYRTVRVVNFAQTAIGLPGTFLVFALVQFSDIPFPLALLLGLAVAAAAGALVGVALLRFFHAGRLLVTVLTIAAAPFVVRLASEVYRLPFFPAPNELTDDQLTGAVRLRPLLPFAGWDFTIGGARPGFGFAEVLTIELALVCLFALGAFLWFTRAGVAVRALSENTERASLLGIGVGGLSVAVWALAGVLSGAGTMLTGLLATPATAGGLSTRHLLTALVAAALARMERLPTAVFASVAITVLTAAWRWSFPDDEPLVFAGLLLALAAALVVHRSHVRADRGSATGWAAVAAPRRAPSDPGSARALRVMRWTAAAIGALALVITPFAFSTGVVTTVSVLALTAVVALSLVVLTGWSGQVSLGQWSFAAVGAVVAGALTATVGLTFWLAVPLAALVAAVFAAGVGIPALRIRGMFLLPVSFAFAVAVQALLFDRRYFGWLLPTEAIERPTLFFVDFRDERSMYFLCLATLLAAIVVVANLRRSRSGRLLIAARDNGTDLQSFGVSEVRTRLLAFALSGGLAGLAGAVFVHHQQGLSAESFAAYRSVEIFVAAVFGGIASPLGAIAGTAWYAFLRYFGVGGVWETFAVNGGPLLVIFAAPGGLVSVLAAARDALLRVVAQRQRLVGGATRVTLAPPEPNAGLAAVRAAGPFALASELYATRQRRDGAAGDDDVIDEAARNLGDRAAELRT